MPYVFTIIYTWIVLSGQMSDRSGGKRIVVLVTATIATTSTVVRFNVDANVLLDTVLFCFGLVQFFFLRVFVYYTRRLFSCLRDYRLYNIICMRSISNILATSWIHLRHRQPRPCDIQWFFLRLTRGKYILYVRVSY